jgi:large subunit ribosomal protein L3
MKFILAKKLEMSQVYAEDGRVIPVTLVLAGPCVVTQVKEEGKDGYKAIQVGFANAKRLNKPLEGHLKELPKFRFLAEFRINEPVDLKRGDVIESSIFEKGEMVNVIGVSKGKGFQGVVKRHGFHGGPASHGHKDQLRMPGSIGAGGVQKVFKGLRMGGHMGDEQVTDKNLQIVEVRDGGILAIKGAVPGARNSLIKIKTA